MKRLIMMLVLICTWILATNLSALSALSAQVKLDWVQVYPGFTKGMLVNHAGDIYVTGVTWNLNKVNDKYKMALIKLNAFSGNVDWDKTYMDSNNGILNPLGQMIVSSSDSDNIYTMEEIPSFKVEVNKWTITFVFSAPYPYAADSVTIHHYSGEPYPPELISLTTQGAGLIGNSTSVVFGRDWDHDITRLLWYAGYGLNFRLTFFKEGNIVWVTEKEVVAEMEGVRFPALEENTGVLPVLQLQNYPNPFNPTTIIQFSLNKNSMVELKIFDAMGKEVTTLISNPMAVGNHDVTFNANGLASGMYYYRLSVDGEITTKSMLLLK